ncbi:ABC transporter permease [Vallitalea maricola]|uniref:ABC transporter permease n=1 Tax=Vallitalea maricola TaxID=3074433 RepID=A0ACB5UMI8_9FIRM|nr:ABC transporter permease [Vallitalea sp. AN17-2]
MLKKQKTETAPGNVINITKKSTSNKSVAKELLGKYGIVLVLVLMVIMMSFLSPVFLTSKNLFNVVRQISVIGLISLGVTLVIISKGIDLSSGSILAVAAVVAASLGQRGDWQAKMFPNLPEMNVIVPIVAALLVGLIAGIINGTLIAKTGIPPFIATLGMMVSARGFAQIYSNGRPVSTLTDAYQWFGQEYVFSIGGFRGIPVPVIIYIIMVIFTFVMLNHTRFGKNIFAIGGNVHAAEVSGINVDRNLIKIYAYAGLLAGLAGFVLSARVNTGQPGMGVSYELDAIAATTIGGTSHSGGIGTIWGAVVGALILGILNNGLNLLGVSGYYQQVLKGVIIVGAVVIDMRKNKKKK